MATTRKYRKEFAMANRKANVFVVLGLKWGDEGKGKVISYLAKTADLAIRATGGANAGHTIYIDGTEIALHLIPSGISSPQVMCLIGKGTVIDFDILFSEIEAVSEILGKENVIGRLKISGTASVLLPYHKNLDALYEKMRGKNSIGTTKRGIGPAYADKVSRNGLKVYDLLLPVEQLEEKIAIAVMPHNALFKAFDMEDCIVDSKQMAARCKAIGNLIKDMVVNGDEFVQGYLHNPNNNIVVEGAQAVRLSLEEGDYPNCTSSDCNINGTLAGAHLAIDDVTEVVGADKAYSSRVGSGPFPTEYQSHVDPKCNLHDYDPKDAELGDKLRDFAREYGATTKRPRRVGAFDAVITKDSCRKATVDYLCITRIDTIGEFGIQAGFVDLCYQYRYKGKTIKNFPDDIEYSKEIPKPCYTKIESGWKIKPGIKTYDELPAKAKEYIASIEAYTGVRVKYIGIGPRNEDMIIREMYE